MVLLGIEDIGVRSDIKNRETCIRLWALNLAQILQRSISSTREGMSMAIGHDPDKDHESRKTCPFSVDGTNSAAFCWPGNLSIKFARIVLRSIPQGTGSFLH